MEYIYAALLLHTAKKPIDESHVKKVLTAAGVTADDARVKALTASLEGINIEDALKTATAAPVMAAAPAGAAAAAPAKEEKKEEKGVSEEEAAAGLSALFG